MAQKHLEYLAFNYPFSPGAVAERSRAQVKGNKQASPCLEIN
jgi:hypothetical protein